MVTCLICQKELMHVYSFKLHLRCNNKCMKVTNDLYYERDLLLQKIEKGDKTKETIDEHSRLNERYNSLIRYKQTNIITPTLYGLSSLN